MFSQYFAPFLATCDKLSTVSRLEISGECVYMPPERFDKCPIIIPALKAGGLHRVAQLSLENAEMREQLERCHVLIGFLIALLVIAGGCDYRPVGGVMIANDVTALSQPRKGESVTYVEGFVFRVSSTHFSTRSAI